MSDGTLLFIIVVITIVFVGIVGHIKLGLWPFDKK